MSGIQFADLGQALAQGQAFRQRESETEYRNALLRRQTDADAREQADAPHVSALLKGDRTALDRVSPGTAIKLAPYLDKLDATKRTQLKDAADYTVQSGMAVLQAPPEQRAQAYGLALEDARKRGLDTSAWPQQWTPQTEGWINFNVNKARPVADYFREQGKGLDPIPGQGGDVLERSRTAISGVESGGRYDAVGPDTGGGKRAYGRYQVMDFNVGPWTAEVLGRPLSPQEFLADPKAQDAVFDAKFGGYIKQFGNPEAAARAWFAGPNGMNNPGAKDVLGTSVAGYVEKFRRGMGPQLAQGDNTRPAADGSGTPLPPDDPKEQVRGLRLPQGAVVRTINGVPIVKDGTVLITGADGKPDFVPLPVRKDPVQAPAGYEPNPAGGLRPIAGGPADPNTQRRERVPPGYRLAPDGTTLEFIPGGPADPAVAKKVGPMTEGQANAALYADRMRAAEKIIIENEAAGLNPAGKALEYLPGGNYLQSEAYQKLEQARRDFINAVLRRESGAVISDQEFANAEKQYFPRPGDKPETLKQKADNRRVALEGISRAAGSSYKPQETAPSLGPAEQSRDQFNTSKGFPKVGTVEQGYRYKGGDPGDQGSWEWVQ